MKNKRFLSLTVTIFLAACSGGLGTMDGIMSSWQGASINEVITQWGYPDQEREIAGHKLYTWNYSKSGFIPAQTTATANTFGNTTYVTAHTTGGHAIYGSCSRTLEVDKKDIVIATQWQGNNCPFAEAFEYASWRRRVPETEKINKR